MSYTTSLYSMPEVSLLTTCGDRLNRASSDFLDSPLPRSESRTILEQSKLRGIDQTPDYFSINSFTEKGIRREVLNPRLVSQKSALLRNLIILFISFRNHCKPKTLLLQVLPLKKVLIEIIDVFMKSFAFPPFM